MVNKICTFKNGLYEWITQRITAMLFVIYIMFLILYLYISIFIIHKDIALLHNNIIFKIFSILSFISIAIHSWIGINTIIIDYISCAIIRFFIKFFVTMLTIYQCFIGLAIIF